MQTESDKNQTISSTITIFPVHIGQCSVTLVTQSYLLSRENVTPSYPLNLAGRQGNQNLTKTEVVSR